MKGKVVISGSTKLLDEALYWKKHFEDMGYEVLNYPHLSENYEEDYKQYFNDIKNCDIFFLMNERKGTIEGYIGVSVFSELTFAVMSNLVEEKKIKILMLDMPSMVLFCYEEIIRWINLGWISFFKSENM
ncbi:MAG: hypothetical protein RSB77_04735 [Bacilli bacterium]